MYDCDCDFQSLTSNVQVQGVVSGGPCDGIMDLGDELIFIGDNYIKGMPLQDVPALLSQNQGEEIVFIVHKGKPIDWFSHCSTFSESEFQRVGAISHPRWFGDQENSPSG